MNSSLGNHVLIAQYTSIFVRTVTDWRIWGQQLNKKWHSLCSGSHIYSELGHNLPILAHDTVTIVRQRNNVMSYRYLPCDSGFVRSTIPWPHLPSPPHSHCGPSGRLPCFPNRLSSLGQLAPAHSPHACPLSLGQILCTFQCLTWILPSSGSCLLL